MKQSDMLKMKLTIRSELNRLVEKVANEKNIDVTETVDQLMLYVVSKIEEFEKK